MPYWKDQLSWTYYDTFGVPLEKEDVQKILNKWKKSKKTKADAILAIKRIERLLK